MHVKGWVVRDRCCVLVCVYGNGGGVVTQGEQGLPREYLLSFCGYRGRLQLSGVVGVDLWFKFRGTSENFFLRCVPLASIICSVGKIAQ